MRSFSPRALAAAALLASLALAAAAIAAPKEPKGADEKAEKADKKDGKKKGKKEEPKEEPKDDKPGVAKAISPYDQILLDAHKAFAAGLAGGALDDAIAGYRKAIANDPARPEGHLFLGGALYQKGDFDAADEALVQAASRARADKAFTNLLGKALFLTATLKEARGQAAEAKTAWAAYEAFAKENPDQDLALKDKLPEGSPTPPVAIKVFLASAMDRQTKLDAWDKRVAEYAKVKELVLKRQKELGIPAEPAKPSEKKDDKK
jgi:predicted Zn-dependent protease